jgi:hypothetical protein
MAPLAHADPADPLDAEIADRGDAVFSCHGLVHAWDRLQYPSDQPRRELPDAPIRLFAIAHGGLRRRRHRNNTGHVLRASSTFALLRAAAQDGSQQRSAVPRDKRTHSLRPSELVSAHAHQVHTGGQRGDVEPAERLHGIGVHKDLRGALVHQRDDGLERLARSRLIVDEHYRDQAHSFVQQVGEHVEVHDTATVDTHDTATACQAGLEHRWVLDGAAECRARAGRNAGYRKVVRLGAAAGEHDVARARSEQPGESFTGVVERPPGRSRDAVAPGRVAKAVGKEREHCRDRLCAHRRGRGVVEIDGPAAFPAGQSVGAPAGAAQAPGTYGGAGYNGTLVALEMVLTPGWSPSCPRIAVVTLPRPASRSKKPAVTFFTAAAAAPPPT